MYRGLVIRGRLGGGWTSLAWAGRVAHLEFVLRHLESLPFEKIELLIVHV